MALADDVSPEAIDEASRALQERDNATAPAPTVSGGQVGASMSGGGSIGDSEVTNDSEGDGTDLPIVTDTPEENDENLGKTVADELDEA